MSEVREESDVIGEGGRCRWGEGVVKSEAREDGDVRGQEVLIGLGEGKQMVDEQNDRASWRYCRFRLQTASVLPPPSGQPTAKCSTIARQCLIVPYCFVLTSMLM